MFIVILIVLFPLLCFYYIKVKDKVNFKIKELEKLVEDGKITKKEIYEIYLENIQKEDDKIGAYLSVSDVVEDKIPIAIKDNINVIGTKTTSASKILENYVKKQENIIFIAYVLMDVM